MIPFFMVLIGSLANAQSHTQWTQLSRMSAHFLDVLQGLTTLKIFGRSRDQAQEIARISAQFRDATMSVLRIAFLSALALEMLATISTAIIAVEIGLRLLYGRLAFEEAFFILILAPEYYGPLRLLGARFHAGTAGVSAAQRIFEVLSCQPAVFSEGAASSAPTTEGRKEAFSEYTSPPFAIHFEEVHYAYEAGERAALNGVSFTIQRGQKVALVGRSGAGKSTAAQLLLRFIEPAGGRITVNGDDLAAIPADVWLEQVAWVPQMPYLFAESAADNIRLARPDAPLEDVIHAAQQAHADTFIRALPDGYETWIGERGARLSGGQAQRIALARAFLKDAPFLIFDEATSNLDPETEAQIQAAIRALMRDRMVLIIAHRLSTVLDADQIVVLDAGYVAEVGTHDELSARAGTYHQLVTAYGK
jgi:ATP-binding cassette subfamily C protein CydD